MSRRRLPFATTTQRQALTDQVLHEVMYDTNLERFFTWNGAGWVDQVTGEAEAVPSTLNNGLVHLWKLDEASGTRADSVGAATLTDNNTVTSSTGKTYPLAAQFTAANDEYLSNAIGDVGLFNVFHLSVWVYFDAFTGAQQWIVSKFNTIGSNRELLVYLDPSDDTLRAVKYTDGVSSQGANSGISPSTGTWHLVEVMHSGTELGIAVDGGAFVTTADTSSFSGTADLEIGGSIAGNVEHGGRIEAVTVWDRVLTANERTELYNSGSGIAYPYPLVGGGGTPSGEGDSLLDGLVAAWPLDGVSGTRNSEFGDFPLNDNNTVTFADGLTRARAAQFTAANSEYLSNTSNLLGGDALTISAWVNFDSLTTDRSIITQFETAGDQRALILEYKQSLDYVRAVVSADGINNTLANTSYVPATGSWTHFELDISATEIRLYADNVLLVTEPHTGGVFDSNGVLRIGSSFAAAFMDGRMADVSIWNRVLTAAERTLLYNDGLGFTYPFRFKPTA